MTHVELRDDSLCWSHRLRFVVGHDECRDQYGRGENVQLGSVQLYFVLIMLCTGRAMDCIASAQCTAGVRRVVLMLEVLAILLDTKDTGGNLDRNGKHRFECIGRGCFYERIRRCFQGFRVRDVTVEGSGKRELKCCHKCSQASMFEASKRSLAEMRCVGMVNDDLNAREIAKFRLGSIRVLQ